MRLWGLGAAAIFMAAPAARAEPPAKGTTGAPGAAQHRPRPPQPEPKPAPPTPGVPDVKLVIETPTTRGPWKMRVTNEGQVPVRVVADARMLSLDVTPRSARKAIHCELPADMRQSDDLDRGLVIPQGRSYAENFEPRLYCFGGNLEALTPGAIVLARLGWTSGPKAEPPYETSPIDEIEPVLTPLKSITALPIALPDEPSPSLLTDPAPDDGRDSEAPRLTLQGPAYVDATSPNDIELAVTIRNDGTRTSIVRFRPEGLRFDIVGPGGAEHCAWPVMPAAAMLEMFSTLKPKGTETLSVTLDSYCTGHGLDQNGVIVVRPRLDTRKASGASLGLRTFDGQLVATTPTVVRLHRGAAPWPSRQPRLEEMRQDARLILDPTTDNP